MAVSLPRSLSRIHSIHPLARVTAWAIAMVAAGVTVFLLLPTGPGEVDRGSRVPTVRNAWQLPIGTAQVTPAGVGAQRVRVAVDPLRVGVGLADSTRVTIYRALAPAAPPRCATLTGALAGGRIQALDLGDASFGGVDTVVRGAQPASVLTVGDSCLDIMNS